MNRTLLSLAALGVLAGACASADNREGARDAVPIGPAPETLEPPEPERVEATIDREGKAELPAKKRPTNSLSSSSIVGGIRPDVFCHP